MYLFFCSSHFWCVALNAAGEKQGSETPGSFEKLTLLAYNFVFLVN